MGRQTQWKKYLLIGGVGGLVLVTTIVVLSNQNGEGVENFWPNYVRPSATSTETKKPDPGTPSEPAEDLIRGLQSTNAPDREAAIQRLKERRDAGMVEPLVRFIAKAEWIDQAPRDAAVAALLTIDPLQAPTALKEAAKFDDPRVRAWAYAEITPRVDPDNQPVLLPVLLGGLKDSDPDLRRLVAEQIRKKLQAPPVKDPSVVTALYSRVCDDVWGEVNNSPPNSFIHNPKADGGKNAALETLEELAPESVTKALNVAARSNNPDVRKWAAARKRDREK